MPAARMTVRGRDPHPVVKLIDLETKADRAIMPTQMDAVHAVAFDPGGRFLAISGGTGTIERMTGRLEVWDLSAPARRMFSVTDSESLFGTVIVAPDGRTVAAVAQSGAARVWDVESGVEQARLSDVHVLAVAPSG